MKDLKSFYKDKIILIAGGVGSIGSEIVRKVLGCEARAIRILDNSETGLFDLEQEIQSEKIRVLVGDIRDIERLKRAIEGVNIVFHVAALKHVPLCESNPFEAVKTNVIGTQNLIDVSIHEQVEKFITISTDKAVNQVNVMGATNLLAETLLVTEEISKQVLTLPMYPTLTREEMDYMVEKIKSFCEVLERWTEKSIRVC